PLTRPDQREEDRFTAPLSTPKAPGSSPSTSPSCAVVSRSPTWTSCRCALMWKGPSARWVCCCAPRAPARSCAPSSPAGCWSTRRCARPSPGTSRRTWDRWRCRGCAPPQCRSRSPSTSPRQGSRCSDPRQHAISLAYIVPIDGETEPQEDALELSWLSVQELSETTILEEMDGGHDIIVRRALAHAGMI